ncbi:LysR family transcriptional regulator [Oleiphilus messinensis]|uniref:LysR family transcriptional regulator n=1 Tax=Oleiphilus messinensis TaxID=141451 RepID=A0A1Y0I8I4_9GAMM|nr:LysR family transcriptional regulator [Oleiphilus messinensis]ARU56817.1 LysR family transcriptional regulator [Oleiphilus messinensis]
MLDSTDINMVQVISEVGSISKAAEMLNMSQPTLSKRLARLESSLGLSLFHRYNGGMLPLHAANFIMENGIQVQSKLNSIHRHLKMLSNLEEGTLNIGVGPIIEQIYFPKVLLDFTEETSNVRITLTTDSGERLLQLIQEGSIDVGIGPFRKSDIPEDLISRSVQSANIILVCRSGHPVLDDIKGNGVVSLLDLSKYPNIGPSTPDSYKEHLPEEFKKFRPLITCENYMSSKSIVSCSDYITGGPEILFEKEIRNGSLVKIPTNFTMQWSSFCIVRPESINIPSVKKFLDIFSSYLTSNL